MNNRKVTRKSANYRQSFLEKYHGNPLVETLPSSLEKDDFGVIMQVEKSLSSAIFQMPSMDAKDVINDLKKTFITTPSAFNLYEHIYIQTRSSYGERNPLSAQIRRLTNELSHKLKSKAAFDVEIPNAYVPVAPTILVSGESGVGKTVSIRRILNMFPQVYEHSSYQSHIFKQLQVVWLTFDMHVSRSKKALAYKFFEELEAVLGISVLKDFVNSRPSADQLMHGMQLACLKYNVGLIHIDEVQYALNRSKSGKDDVTLPELEALFNKLGVPMVLSTTKDALDDFNKGLAPNDHRTTKLQTIRRANQVAHIKFPQWRIGKSYTSEFFNQYFSESLYIDTKVDSDEFRILFLVLCAGIPDAMSALGITFNRTWYDKVRANGGNSLGIDPLKLLKQVYAARMDQWHEELERLRQSYSVSEPAKEGVSKKSSDSRKTSFSSDVVDVIPDMPIPRTTRHQPKPASEDVRIDEGPEIIDAEYEVTYDRGEKNGF